MSGDGSSILFASANRSVRHPSFTDLYYTVGGAFGSRDLTSEWADHLETGVRLSLAKDATYGVQFEQALFQRQGHDLIDGPVPTEATPRLPSTSARSPSRASRPC